ncbi:MAG: HAD family phosphatase [Solobacterium sp.]|nr:HAD family phosphatase [Solobacterium sp.]
MYEQIRLFATDLDDTLLVNGNLTAKGREALIRLRKKGILVVIASGRPYYSVKRIIPDEAYDYACCYNGQDIYQASTGRHILAPCLDDEEKEYLLSFLKKYDVFGNASDEKESYYFCHQKHKFYRFAYTSARNVFHVFLKRHSYPRTIRTDYSLVMDIDCAKICFAGFPFILKTIQKQLDDRFTSFFVNPCWLEIQKKGISKGNALQMVMQMEHVLPSEAVAAGDGENDIPLLEACQYGIAMANAMPKLQKTANIHIGFSYLESLPKWIEKNLL